MTSRAINLSSSPTLKLSSSPALRIEGGLLGPDVLEALAHGDLPGQKPADFGLPANRSLTEEIAAAFNDARAQWGVFQNRLERLPENETGTSETREFWVIPLLRLLGYSLQYRPRALEVDGATFAISHIVESEKSEKSENGRAREHESTRDRVSRSHALTLSRSHPLTLSPSHPLIPVHIVSARQELGRVAPSGRPRLSPHALVQEYLNRTDDALWGLVTNGLILRLLRDSTYVRRQAYIEFDLQAIIEEDRFADFALLYRLLHRTRLPADGAAPEDCLLETYYQQAIEQGGRVREHLRDGVEQAIQILANGFLTHPANESLRESMRTREQESTSLPLYQQLLRLIYRLLFLLVSEERGLMGGNPLYREHYGISRLRRLTEQRAAWTDDVDLWHSLRALWEILCDEEMAALLDVPPLNGELFAELNLLDNAVLANRDLLAALWHLTWYQEDRSAPPRRVNYAALDTEELGSVYESLLDYHPAVTFDAAGRPRFELAPGSERKSTGSYYTPPQLVAELVRSALEPVIAERLRAGERESYDLNLSRSQPPNLSRSQALERALLSIKVCDPACGSGHFLLAAARRLGLELARIRSGEEQPAPERVREATRDVIAHCIYGVDRNPLAVELCRVALWLESHAAGKPLTFLDHRIKCGDSLVGVFDLEALKDGLPDDAFQPVSDDDRKIAASLKKQNKQEREGQLGLFGWNLDLNLEGLAQRAAELDAIADDSPEAVRRKRALYEARFADPDWERQKLACDLWTAAFFQPYSRSHALPPSTAPITTDAVRRALSGQGGLPPQTVGLAQALAAEHRFFHWPLEFPEIFAEHESGRAGDHESHPLHRSSSPALPLSRSPGFDVVLGNPPWEQIQLEEQEFFAPRDARIASAPNAAARKRLIQKLPQTDPALWAAYQQALQAAESVSRFLRGSGQYPFTGRGRINTYSVFAERARALLAPQGRAGIIVPTGIATDATNQYFFADLVEKGQLASLFDFENREAIFPGVHRSYKFSLLTLSGEHESTRTREHESPALPLSTSQPLTFSFFATNTAHLRDPRRVFSLTAEDIARINPNTRTLPVFRTRQDAELTRAIYRRVPVLINERTGENPWSIKFRQGLFNMSSDSHLFRTRAELEAQGYRLVGNVFVRTGDHESLRAREHESPALSLSPSPALYYLPLYEAKMIWHYDHRYGTYEGVTSRSSTHLPTPGEREHADPDFVVQPWYWVDAAEVQARLGDWKRGWLLGFRKTARATDERTVIANTLNLVGVGDKAPLLFPDLDPCYVPLLLANLNALVLDFVARNKVGGTDISHFYMKQFPVLPPSAYTAADLRFIVPRVLELTYTAWDLKPFADDVWRDADDDLRAAILQQVEAHESKRAGEHESTRAREYESTSLPLSTSQPLKLPPFKWDESRRARLQAELDAYYARLYGLTRKQLRYILDPADLTEKELEDILDPWEEVADPLDPAGYEARVAASDFPGETFRVLKDKELRAYGEYHTRRLVLEAWERLSQGGSRCP
ncbi:DNA methyltransferase [Litorilinea aerophila]|uniref:site-specific DNA-methyltransferase (adenine-specific) n=1 Tax=Litorilinea aerophila TaxID=1204385 RepID=A0A540VEA3_9CHLR